MSAAEKLKVLEKHMRRHKTEMLYPESARLRDALPQIVAVVEAASQQLHYTDGRAVMRHKPDECQMCDALAALDEALGNGAGNFLEPATPSVLSDPDQTSGAASEGNEGALGVAVQRAEVAERENERLREALETILSELGVPGDDYAAPVTNAVEIALAALAARTEERTE